MHTRNDLTRLLAALRLAWSPTDERWHLWVTALGLRVAILPSPTRRAYNRAGRFTGEVLGQATDTRADGLIIGPTRGMFVDATDGYASVSQALLVACRECGGWYVCGESGAWRCRHCGAWDGNDHVFDVHDVSVWTGRIMLVDPLGIAVSAARFAQDIRQAA